MTITFSGSGILSGSGTQDGPNNIALSFVGGMLSADGTASCPPSGAALMGVDGTISWGTLNTSYGTPGYRVVVNGTPISTSAALQMVIQDSGHLYALGIDNAWYKLVNGAFVAGTPSVIPSACP
jgi:hypothetical protein